MTPRQLIQRIERQSYAEGRAHAIHCETGSLLKILTRLLQAQRVLEIGFGFGASAIYIGTAMQKGGRIDSIEVSREHIAIGQRNTYEAGIADMVNVIEGDARDMLPRMKSRYDLVLLDADISIYCDCFPWLIDKTRVGGVILADNVWDEATALRLGGPDGVREIQRFTEMVRSNKQLCSSLLDDVIISYKTCG